MNVAHIIPYVGRRFGGPVFALSAMTASLAAQGQSVAIFSIHSLPDGDIMALPSTVVTYINGDSTWGSLRHSAGLWETTNSVDISLIHSHGLWTDVHRCAAVMARRKRLPHVLGPCGMLEPNALRRSRWKKWLVKIWFQDRALREANCLLANSEKEYRDIRAYGLTNPVAIVPNPVPGPESIVHPVTVEEFISRYPSCSGKNLLLYLGRIHPVKGVSRLVQAWSQIAHAHPDWLLVLAGPDEGGYRDAIEKLISQTGCRDTILFTGPLDDAGKWAALHLSDIFVMPSDFENFGIAIVEAMLAGKPVITTTGTPWQVLAENHAGWWVEPTSASLEKALRQTIECGSEERRLMGERGRALAVGFAPDIVAGMLIALYEWLLGRSARPDFVRTY